MSHHTTEGVAIENAIPAPPLACRQCGCTDLLHAVGLAEIRAATARTGDAPVPEDTNGTPLRNSQCWPQRGLFVCRNCVRVELRFDQLVPAALPPSSADTPQDTPGEAS
jgi:hypothetical protein